MAFHKTNHYPKLEQQASHYARAFGHPERLEILLFLKSNRYATVTDIAKRSSLALPTVSQHLKYLRDSGLIQAFEDYPYVRYAIDDNIFQSAIRNLVKVWTRIAADGQLISAPGQ